MSSTVKITRSESGEYDGGKWEPDLGSVEIGQLTAAQLSGLLQGQTVVKFEVENYGGNEEAIIRFSKGAKIHVRWLYNNAFQVEYSTPQKNRS